MVFRRRRRAEVAVGECVLFEELGALLQELLARDVAVIPVTRAVPRKVPAAIPSVASLYAQ